MTDKKETQTTQLGARVDAAFHEKVRHLCLSRKESLAVFVQRAMKTEYDRLIAERKRKPEPGAAVEEP